MQENLDWADLVTLDFSLYGTSEGKKQLVNTLVKAVREDGFFYVKNFNISQERVNRQFSIGKQFHEIPLEEKLKYVPEGLGEGTYELTSCKLIDMVLLETMAHSMAIFRPVVGCTV